MSASVAAQVNGETLHEIISRFGLAHLDAASCEHPDLDGSDELSKEHLEEELLVLGLASTYDAIYVPARGNMFCKGYACINFVTVADACRASEALNGYVFTGSWSTKPCSVSSAVVQGREALLQCEETDFDFGVDDNSPIEGGKELSSPEKDVLSEHITTFMLRNIPCKLTKELMEEELCELGFGGTYDVIHFPSRNNGSNKGYGFINFLTADDARRVTEALEGHVFAGTRSPKRCCVSTAAFQGREALLTCVKQERSVEERPQLDDDNEQSTHKMQDPKPITTLMLSCIHNRLTREIMEEELRCLGFEGTYDVIHIPMRNNRYNKGYAFINLLTPDDARRFTDALNGYAFMGARSTKRCRVTAAGFQGREAMLRRINDSL
eukprot:TRINITY_DN6016_c1_g1_i1.p1 TRINITY_DN6016_c1_g1~~TRINITY_DN6016_c1_g1_i1.p1  ORF type:complete len:381 (+),score=50.52 TRINITY_DN6016_c1_g1_i1:197-1339(+)